jgi:manganese/iron transport system ATP-binding protein/manganese/zinc/iron transport system ATP- binding protein
MYAFGTPQMVLNEELLSNVYEGRLRIFSDIIKQGET